MVRRQPRGQGERSDKGAPLVAVPSGRGRGRGRDRVLMQRQEDGMGVLPSW